MSLSLRPYAAEAFERVCAAWEAGTRAILVEHPTGTGKARLATAFAQREVDAGRRVLLLVDRDHLVANLVQQAWRTAGLALQVEQGQRKAYRLAPAVCASVQTLHDARLSTWDPGAFDLVICDEAHHAVSPSWMAVLRYFGRARVLGLTATPDRSDRKSMGALFGAIAHRFTVLDAITEGWLVPVRQLQVAVSGLDFRKVRVVANRFNQGDVAAIVEQSDIVARMAEPLVELSGTRPTIAFCASIAQARALAEILTANGRRAASIDYKRRKEARDVLARFNARELDVVTNVGMIREGYDCPPTSCVAVCTPVLSRGAYSQMVGRGLRPASEIADKLGDLDREGRRTAIRTSSKPDCVVLDFAGASNQSLVRVVDVLAPNDEVKRRVARVVDEGGDVADAVQLALGNLEWEEAARQLVERARQQPLLGVTWHTMEVDPFAMIDGRAMLTLMGVDIRDSARKRKAASWQITRLRDEGIADAASIALSDLEAIAALRRLANRKERGLSSPDQIRALTAAGTLPINAIRMTYARAQAGVEEVRRNHGQRPVEWGAPIPRAANGQAAMGATP